MVTPKTQKKIKAIWEQNINFYRRLMQHPFFSPDVNGLNPVWNKKFDFDVDNPSCALLRFVVQDLDVFSDPIDLGQAIIPVSCLRSGYRSVPLRNSYSEELELASLLIHLDIHKVSTHISFIATTIHSFPG